MFSVAGLIRCFLRDRSYSMGKVTSRMMSNTLHNILYVEDDPDIRIVGLLALEQVGGFSVSVASSGMDALASATNKQPDLVLLDMIMPEMDGLTTLERLREDSRTASIPVIFMTAKAQGQEIRQYHEAGAMAVIPKPFDPMTLAEQIREIWRQHQ